MKCYISNDETISDQPTESLRELILLGGTPLLFVETVQCTFSEHNTINFSPTHIELFALLLE